MIILGEKRKTEKADFISRGGKRIYCWRWHNGAAADNADARNKLNAVCDERYRFTRYT